MSDHMVKQLQVAKAAAQHDKGRGGLKRQQATAGCEAKRVKLSGQANAAPREDTGSAAFPEPVLRAETE